MSAYMMEGYISEHFQIAEFCNTKAEESVKFVFRDRFKDLVEMLEDVRAYTFPRTGRGLHINSGYRTASYNEIVGGSPNSEHLDGLAVDVAVKSIPQKYFGAVCAIWEVLCNQRGLIGTVGFYDTHIHLGIDGGRNGRTAFYVYDKRG